MNGRWADLIVLMAKPLNGLAHRRWTLNSLHLYSLKEACTRDKIWDVESKPQGPQGKAKAVARNACSMHVKQRGHKGNGAKPINAQAHADTQTQTQVKDRTHESSGRNEFRTHWDYRTWKQGNLFFQILKLRTLWSQCPLVSSKAPTALTELPPMGCLWPETSWLRVKKR